MVFIMAKLSVLGELILLYKINNELSLDRTRLTEVRLSYYIYGLFNQSFATFTVLNLGEVDTI